MRPLELLALCAGLSVVHGPVELLSKQYTGAIPNSNCSIYAAQREDLHSLQLLHQFQAPWNSSVSSTSHGKWCSCRYCSMCRWPYLAATTLIAFSTHIRRAWRLSPKSTIYAHWLRGMVISTSSCISMRTEFTGVKILYTKA